MRRKMGLILAFVCALAVPLQAADFSAFAGRWQGPWYRGMTSGQMTLEVAADGTGRVSFTNLENFGDVPADLRKMELREHGFEFTASGAGGDFSGRTTRSSDGKLLRGTARYAGFPVKFELHRQ